MLLFEVLTRQEEINGVTKLKPWMDSHLNQPAGVRHQDIHPAKEEHDDPSIMEIINKIGTVPIVTAYILPQNPKVGEFDERTHVRITPEEAKRVEQVKDAIKQRSPIHVMDEGDIYDVALKAIEKIASLKPQSPALKGKQGRTLQHLHAVQKRLKGGNAVLVPVASSSKLPTLFAQIAGQKLNIPVLQGFAKRVGKTSKHYWTKARGFEDRPNFKDGVEEKLQKMEQQLYQLYAQKASADQIKAAEREFEEYRNKAMRQATKGKGQIDYRRGVYGTQEVVDEALLDLDGKDVILVDDNVYEGLTIQNAVMALARMGISPNSVSAIAIHEFY